jgi:D-glycero-alpha-D-manno-heptose-7-phosphate kinase
MIIVRTPVRITLGGGGTDLPSYYSKYEGDWISASIDKYIYIIVNKHFEDSIRLSYSKTEEVHNANSIKHPIVKNALKLLGVKNGIEIVSIADVPSMTGLGTSGAFTVGLLTALYKFLEIEKKIKVPSREKVAEQACNLAMNVLKEPSGKQDEYISAYGGITSFHANKSGNIKITSLFPGKLSIENYKELEHNLLMFYTGIRRESKKALSAQKISTEKKQQDIIENLHRVKKIGKDIEKAILSGNLTKFGELLDLHWQEKVKRPGTVNPQIKKWYDIAKENGALGGKLMGAGGGGFFMFYCENDKTKLRKAMKKNGLQEKIFHFDTEGTKTIANFI